MADIYEVLGRLAAKLLVFDSKSSQVGQFDSCFMITKLCGTCSGYRCTHMGVV